MRQEPVTHISGNVQISTFIEGECTRTELSCKAEMLEALAYRQDRPAPFTDWR